MKKIVHLTSVHAVDDRFGDRPLIGGDDRKPGSHGFDNYPGMSFGRSGREDEDISSAIEVEFSLPKGGWVALDRQLVRLDKIKALFSYLEILPLSNNIEF